MKDKSINLMIHETPVSKETEYVFFTLFFQQYGIKLGQIRTKDANFREYSKWKMVVGTMHVPPRDVTRCCDKPS